MFDTLFGNLTSLGTVAVIGTNEILRCAGGGVLLFGGTKLSQLGKGLGEGIREFKASLTPANAAATGWYITDCQQRVEGVSCASSSMHALTTGALPSLLRLIGGEERRRV